MSYTMTTEQAKAYEAAWRLKIAAELMMADLAQGEGTLAIAQLQSIDKWYKALQARAKGL